MLKGYNCIMSFSQLLKTERSLLGSHLGVVNSQWYNEINDELILGALPLKSHFEALGPKICAVVSLVEDHEYREQLLGSPMQPKEWEEYGKKVFRYPNLDGAPVPLKDVQKAVEDIRREYIRNNQPVYVHCMAGVGRSATVVICYLMKYHFKTPKEAVDMVQSKRNIVVKPDHPTVDAFFTTLS